jgi:hypothetical protein
MNEVIFNKAKTLLQIRFSKFILYIQVGLLFL